MIPNEDLFFGALGKTRNIGNSKLFTTAHTISPVPDFILDTKVKGDFLCCTLNGKLWAFVKSETNENNETTTKTILVALNYNNGFNVAATLELDTNEELKARGIDWLLTDKLIIQVVDTSPYILKENLTAESAPDNKFLYSLLRASFMAERIPGITGCKLGSGIDPFTLEAWDNMSDGYLSTNFERIYKACYSNLPSVGDWIIAENFLIKKPEAPLNSDYSNYMKQMRPLIPLEFNWYGGTTIVCPTYGFGFNSDIAGLQIFYSDEKLFAKGITHIGRVYILPAAFNQDGTPEEFYLYISPDYLCSPYNQYETPKLTHDEKWDELCISSVGEDILGFIGQKDNPLNPALCPISTDMNIFSLQTKEWSSKSENEGNIIFDSVAKEAVALENGKISFINGSVYTCAKFPEWLTYSTNFGTASKNLTISSFEGGILVTNIEQNFCRVYIPDGKLPYTVNEPNEKTFAMSERNGTIKAYEVYEKLPKPVKQIQWDEIYKEAVSIRVLNITDKIFKKSGLEDTYPIAFEGENTVEVASIYDDNYLTYFMHLTGAVYTFFYISPETGQISTSASNIIFKLTPIPNTMEDVDLSLYYAGGSSWPWIDGNAIEVKIAYFHAFEYWDGYWDYTDNGTGPPLVMIERLGSVPPELINWSGDVRRGMNVFEFSQAENSIIFSEISTKTKFSIKIENLGKAELIGAYGDESVTVIDNRGRRKTLNNFFIIEDEHHYYFIRADINNDVFNFDDELTRSKLFNEQMEI